MSEDRKRQRRRTVLSNPAFQIKLIVIFALLAILYAVTNFYVSLNTLNAVSADMKTLAVTEQTSADIQILLDQRRSVLVLQLSLITALSLAMLILGGVYLSHKIGGPLGRLYRYMQSIVDGWGSPQPIHFRKYDFFTELAAAFDRFQRHVGVLKPPPTDDASPGDDPQS